MFQNFFGVRKLTAIILLWGWHWRFWSSFFDLRNLNNSCTLALSYFHLFWFVLHLHFFASFSILTLGLAMIGLAFLSSYLYKSTYTTVHRCSVLPLMLRNHSILPKSFCLYHVHHYTVQLNTIRCNRLSFVNEPSLGFTNNHHLHLKWKRLIDVGYLKIPMAVLDPCVQMNANVTQ